MSNKAKGQAKQKPGAKKPVDMPFLPVSKGLYGAFARAQVIHYVAQQLNDSVAEDQILAVLFIYFNPETARRYLHLAKQLIGHGA